MTREQNFRTSFIYQLNSYSGWQNILRTDIQKLPTADFPAFSLDLGKTKYISFDPSGKAISGEQDFSLTIYYTLPLRLIEAGFTEHSDLTNNGEQFMNDPIYAPPIVVSGDNYRIERCAVIEVRAPAIQTGDTRFSVTLNGKYIFTLF